MHTVYFRSISNELAIDRDVWYKRHQPGQQIQRILLPRPFKTKSLGDFLAKRNLVFLIRLLCFVWIWIPFPIMTSYACIRTLIKKIKLAAAGKKSVPLQGNLAVVSGMYASKLFAEPEFKDHLKIQVASEVQLTSSENNPLWSVLDFSSFGVIFRALYHSFAVVIKNYGKMDGSLKLQTFVTYEWVLLYLILQQHRSKIEKIAFTNHYDRWAVMFDSFAFRHTALYQHGLVLPSEKMSLPAKHRNITVLYAYNTSSIDFFRNEAIESTATTEYKIRVPRLEVTDMQTDGKKLLLIGTPYDPQKELDIIRMILENIKDILIYIKPHPSFDQSAYTAFDGHERVILIRDRNLFPKVDITLSFLSTLAVQYETVGIPNVQIKTSDTASHILSELIALT